MNELPPDLALRFQASNGKAIQEIQKGNPGASIPLLEEALGICEDPLVLSNYGDALARCGRLEDAKRAFLRSIELKPDYDQAHYNLGVVYDQLEMLEEARESYLRSIECRVVPMALNNCANAETYLLKLPQAEDHYRRAVKHGYSDSRWNLSLCLMMQGKWKEAWDLYECRPQMAQWKDHPLLWRGESVKGKTLVVITEQGLGDSIFALRYVEPLRAMGANLVIGCEPTLMRMVQALVADTDPELPPVRVFDRTTMPWNEHYDYVTLAMSIPGYLSPEGIGPRAPYLKAPKVRMSADHFNVGLCWNGSTVVGPPKERNIELKLLAPLAAVEGVRLVSLQKGEAAAEMADCGFDIADAMTTARDVYDTAAVVNSLDLVISIDTMIPHLAGALGKPVWLMNRFMSCWQWGTPEYDPCLYETVAQFRQLRRREWGPVVEWMTHGLRRVVEARAGIAQDAPA